MNGVGIGLVIMIRRITSILKIFCFFYAASSGVVRGTFTRSSVASPTAAAATHPTVMVWVFVSSGLNRTLELEKRDFIAEEYDLLFQNYQSECG